MRILVDAKIPHIAEALTDLGEVGTYDAAASFGDELSVAEVLVTRSVTRVDADLLRMAPRLRFVGSATAGIDHVDLAALRSRGVAFAHAPGANARAVAEYVVASVARAGIPEGATVAVVGFGQVGRRVTALLRTLGFHVRVNDPPLAEDPDGARASDGLLRMARAESYLDLNDAVDGAQVLTVHVPLVHAGPHATYHLIDAPILERLAPGAVVVNTARGGVLEEAALVRANTLRAILDVWEGEPHVSGSVIHALGSRLLLATPHIAGYTVEAKARCTAAIQRALSEYLGRAVEWNPPFRSDPELELPPEASLADALELVRDLTGRDAELRALARAGDLDRSRAFEQLRRTADSHELWTHRIVGGSPALRETIARLRDALPPEL